MAFCHHDVSEHTCVLCKPELFSQLSHKVNKLEKALKESKTESTVNTPTPSNLSNNSFDHIMDGLMDEHHLIDNKDFNGGSDSDFNDFKASKAKSLKELNIVIEEFRKEHPAYTKLYDEYMESKRNESN